MVFDAKTVSMLVKETWRTLYMVGLSSLISYLIGIPLGVTTLNGVAAMPDFGDLGNVMFNLDFKGVFTASGLILVFVCFFGDFFSTLSAEAITGALTGCRDDRTAVLDALRKNGIDGAVYQISAADMAALIAD